MQTAPAVHPSAGLVRSHRVAPGGRASSRGAVAPALAQHHHQLRAGADAAARVKLAAPTSRTRRGRRAATKALFGWWEEGQEAPEAAPSSGGKRKVVVVGNGMVGLKFLQKMAEYNAADYEVVTFCEEERPAYHRMNLTKFFDHRDAAQLELAPLEWYAEAGVTLHLGDRVEAIDRDAKMVTSAQGRRVPYDVLVLATGSKAFVPPIPGVEPPRGIESCEQEGVFVYRTIKDLELLIAHAEGGAKSAAVFGGGLLGLEAAKAASDLGLKTTIVEYADRLMPRQIDDDGNDILRAKIEALGLDVKLAARTEAVTFDSEGAVSGVRFEDGERLEVDTVVLSTGIAARDELARECGLELGPRGGVAVNARCQSVTDPAVFAIGEVATHEHSAYGTMTYGLVVPGYEMADAVAKALCGVVPVEEAVFAEADLSTKLKLMGVDVASFGNNFPDPAESVSLMRKDPFGGLYKKLFFSKDGTRLLGGTLVGDASEYATLLAMAKSGEPLTMSPHELVYGAEQGEAVQAEMGADFQVCQCNDVSKGAIVEAIQKAEFKCSPAELKQCTNAGTGCGGCEPLVAKILLEEKAKQGMDTRRETCEHLPFTRPELVHIVRTEGHRTFEQVLAKHGRGHGCELCKPVVAGILAIYRNEHVLSDTHAGLQDSNDRFLANIQRGGSYSVVPRVPAGEITPEQLIRLGEVAKEYNLYSKITGAQRVDLFGANRHDLPAIWRSLGEVGFESGAAYAKGLRMVKSCVGSAWCRFGVQDSVDFAVRVEHRYKGVRAPHKVKAAVSGCTRECAEVQSKDFGMIATESGYNVYVGGNGGMTPAHAFLLEADCSEARALQLIDRFLMFYARTADKLQRTAPWVRALPGGFEYLKAVIVEDSLGICDTLEREMQFLVDTYVDEWAAVVADEELQKPFREFMNAPEAKESGIEFVAVRGQPRPADWPKGQMAPSGIEEMAAMINMESAAWVSVGVVADFPASAGQTVRYGKSQLAVFNLAGEWFATQNMCPHRRAFVLARGIVGEAGGAPKVACPLHKKTFDLASGRCTSDAAEEGIMAFEAKLEGGEVLLKLPPAAILDAILGTDQHEIKSSSCKGAEPGGLPDGLAACQGTAVENFMKFVDEAKDSEDLSGSLN